jgi:hypothetical protein
MLERGVMAYLAKRAKQAGGEVRKVKWIGRSHAPDALVMLPGLHFYVEGKRPGKVAETGQLREHQRMQRCGMHVWVVDTFDVIDNLFDFYGFPK